MNNTLYFSHRDKRANIYELQTYLRYLSRHISGIPSVIPDGIYGPETRAAVGAFQKRFGLPDTGDADFETWSRIVKAYDELTRTKELRPIFVYPPDIPHFKEGDESEEIYILQIMLRRLATKFKNITSPQLTGVFDFATKSAAEDVARLYGKAPTGLVERELWNIIADAYSAFTFND